MKPNIGRRLTALFKVIREEAERNPTFAGQLEDALGLNSKQEELGKRATASGGSPRTSPSRPRAINRRPLALLNPRVVLENEGDAALKSELAKLNIEQLKDIVAEHGMDPGKLIMKWKDSNRIADRIVEMTIARAHKGDAFRD